MFWVPKNIVEYLGQELMSATKMFQKTRSILWLLAPCIAVLTPFVARSLVAMILTMYGRQRGLCFVLFQLPVQIRFFAVSSKKFSARVNTLRPRQNGRHFADDIFKCIFLNENAWIAITISLNFVPKGPINNIPALVQIMAWCHPGNKPLSEPVMVSLLTHICVTRPQWVKKISM